ncbi:hypothetical protein ACMA46_12520 [Clavibacter sp. Sh2141]|uniref:hypothetical protein n=1 Tax=Clavibacter sp. Sh2141 TaxID=3395374 RepID=UPI0039BD7DBE
MPVVDSRRIVPVEPAVAFAISQTQGEVRTRTLAVWRYGFARGCEDPVVLAHVGAGAPAAG